MACARFVDYQHPLHTARQPAAAMRVTVWRVLDQRVEWIYTYAGDVDSAVIESVLAHVVRFAEAVGGACCVEVVATGLGPHLLHLLKDGVRDLRRRGLLARLALIPRLPLELRPGLWGAAASAAAN